eukprot:scaffold1616_cov395-Prasinococcus_capsulatus_cf.AAC.5
MSCRSSQSRSSARAGKADIRRSDALHRRAGPVTPGGYDRCPYCNQTQDASCHYSTGIGQRQLGRFAQPVALRTGRAASDPQWRSARFRTRCMR